jgi:hypothetical protein
VAHHCLPEQEEQEGEEDDKKDAPNSEEEGAEVESTASASAAGIWIVDHVGRLDCPWGCDWFGPLSAARLDAWVSLWVCCAEISRLATREVVMPCIWG